MALIKKTKHGIRVTNFMLQKETAHMRIKLKNLDLQQNISDQNDEWTQKLLEESGLLRLARLVY